MKSEFTVTMHNRTVLYTVTHPDNIAIAEAWMRSVNRDLSKQDVSKKERLAAYSQHGWDQIYMNRRYKKEGQLSSTKRVTYHKSHVASKSISSREANKRVRKAAIRSAKRMKEAQEQVNSAIAPVLAYGLLRTERKYQQVRRLNMAISKGHTAHGISLAQYPQLDQVKHLAEQVYSHPELLTSTPDWVLRQRKGRLHDTGKVLVRPDQKVTVTNIDPEEFTTEEEVHTAITRELEKKNMIAIGTKIRKGQVLNKPSIAAVIYFESAYHAKCALLPLAELGRVHLGVTVATARVVASKVDPTIRMLLSEAKGILTEEQWGTFPSNTSLAIQLWIDKDGSVSFIKIKLIDLTYKIYTSGESRVANLVEYIGDEGECRRFLPSLIDQFAQTNETLFALPNNMLVHVVLRFITGDHKALYTMTGRSGGNARRDQFCKHALAHMYHSVLNQGETSFDYSDFVQNWNQVNLSMETYKESMLQINKRLTQAAEAIYREDLYRRHGRIDRVPAFMYGICKAQPSVYGKLVLTPLNLHNDTYGNLTTIELMFKITKDQAPELRKLMARWQGLVDAFGQTKCSVSGEGVRRLLNDCLPLESAIKDDKKQKYAALWWLKDTISYHLRLKRKRAVPDDTAIGGVTYTAVALDDHERLKFAASTLLWWLLLGDLSHELGGRKTEKKKITKNHLEDKVYPYELARACVEFEEIMKTPLSLVNEAIFEASFVFRDELINAYRSKVDIERERKGAFYKELCNAMVPPKRKRSCIGGIDHLHQARTIIIRSCWTRIPKWSFNVRRGFLLRAATLSYRRDIDICPIGPHKNAIRIFTNKNAEEHFHTAQRTNIPDLIIDPCGSCPSQLPHPRDFSRSIVVWFCITTLDRIATYKALGASYHQRLLEVNKARARARHDALKTELDKKHPDALLVQRTYDGYNILQQKWPDHIPAIQTTDRLTELLNIKRPSGKIWDGDIHSEPIQDICKLKVDKLKEIIRYFQIRNVKPGLTLKGKKAELLEKVRDLLNNYSQYTALASSNRVH